jgi:DNA-binding transcriptional ArsR family regulator
MLGDPLLRQCLDPAAVVADEGRHQRGPDGAATIGERDERDRDRGERPRVARQQISGHGACPYRGDEHQDAARAAPVGQRAQLLATEGPHTMSQLAEALGVSPPRLGNHLARLRAAGLVTVEHAGRHAVYRVTGGGIADVLTALSRYVRADGMPGQELLRSVVVGDR